MFFYFPQADISILTKRLSRLEFKPPTQDKKMALFLRSPPESAGFGQDAQGIDALRAQVQLLRSLRLSPAPTQGVTLSLPVLENHTSVTESVMDALRDLPAWEGSLNLGKCKWPLSFKRYERLAECIPVSYSDWNIDVTLSTPLFSSICVGGSKRREGLGLPPLKMYVRGFYGPEKRVNKHVIVMTHNVWQLY